MSAELKIGKSEITSASRKKNEKKNAKAERKKGRKLERMDREPLKVFPKTQKTITECTFKLWTFRKQCEARNINGSHTKADLELPLSSTEMLDQFG